MKCFRGAAWFWLLLIAAERLALAEAELRFCLRAEPKTLDPLLASDEASEAVRYLTGGVLIRFNRKTQQLESGLAESWKVLDGGRRITFQLRRGVLFSDGTPFSATDVAATMKRMMDPDLHSPVGDSFRSGSGFIKTEVAGPDRISILFTAPVAGLDRLFDQLSISPASSQGKEQAVLGPYMLAEHVAGSYVLLRRNKYYWKIDSQGVRLPYIDLVRLYIQQNREIELRRFRQGEIHFITNLDPEMFERLTKEMPGVTYDAGASLDSEMLWFNQMPTAPIPPYKRAWFQSQQFRRALSEALRRDDMCRLVYRGHARPAAGPVSATNLFWFNSTLRPLQFDKEGALRRLQQAGFHQQGGSLRDGHGNIVEFSIITNSGSAIRAQLAALIQQDLGEIGIRINVVTLDFASLIERITRTFQYEACLLGLTNVEPDPNSQMNVWLSSGSSHPWNPNQKTSETAWEAEIDRLMRAQATTLDEKKRKVLFGRVQEIVSEEAPILYLVNRNALMAVSAALHNVTPVALTPNLYWNVEHLWLAPGPVQKR